MHSMKLICLVTLGGLAAGASAGDPAPPPDSITLIGVVRDFRDDHPDFQRKPKNAAGYGSFGHYMDIASEQLDDDGNPAFMSTGRKVTSEWTNASGQKIAPGLDTLGYIDTKHGDSPGDAEASGDAVESAETFAQWYRDVDGVNVRKALKLTLVRDPQTGSYVFDDTQDPTYSGLGGFFPINGQLYGDYQDGKNFHFTFELDTEFRYDAGTEQVFRFIGDDDVWVYIDGKRVIDLGGVHSKIDQVVELDRLNWLKDGETYSLKFFFAERHTTQSNFRIETNLLLRTVDVPLSSALHD